MKVYYFPIFILVMALCAHAEPFSPKLPAKAKTVEEITRVFEEQRGNGYPQWAHIRGFDRELLVVWNCPFSGRAATFVFAYAYDGATWTRFYDKLLEGTHDISVQSPSGDGQREQLTIRGWDGATLATLPLDSLPSIHHP